MASEQKLAETPHNSSLLYLYMFLLSIWFDSTKETNITERSSAQLPPTLKQDSRRPVN